MRKKKTVMVAFAIFAVACLIYGRNARRFDQRVRTFSSIIKIGDSFDTVRIQMGRPSRVLSGCVTLEQTDKGQNIKTAGKVLWIYSGLLYFRNDLCLIFDCNSERLIEKNRDLYEFRK